MVKLLPEYSKATQVEPSFYLPDIDGISDLMNYKRKRK